MKVETYAKKFYDVHVEVENVFEGSKSTDTKIWLSEKGGEYEPIGFLLKLDDCETYQWHRIYGPLPTGKAFLGDEAVKKALKEGLFYR
jgi:hypothetical protein